MTTTTGRCVLAFGYSRGVTTSTPTTHLLRIVEHHSNHVQGARQKLDEEVEDSDAQACNSPNTSRTRHKTMARLL